MRPLHNVRSIAAGMSALLLGSASSALVPGPAAADAAVSIIQVTTAADLHEKFCTADPLVEHVVVLPATLFVDSEELVCPVGPYKLYRIIEHNDEDDFEYYLDPPFGTAGRLACDGKAGRGMAIIAVNCRPLK